MKKILFIVCVAFGMAACQSKENKIAAAEISDTAKTAAFNSVDNAGARIQPINAENPNPVDTSNFTTILWVDKINQNLPKIKEGEVVEVTFRFRNTGSKPLIVQNVSASCGCTVPEKPEEPILPGKEGLIRAKFDSKGRIGPNTKVLTVLANTNSDKILTFSVDVEK